MADTAKGPRKTPQPRGLLMELPLDHTQRALQLAQGAGLSTKAEVEAALAEFVIGQYLEPFLFHLGNLAISRVKKLLGSEAEPTPPPPPPDQQQRPADGGIPSVGSKTPAFGPSSNSA